MTVRTRRITTTLLAAAALLGALAGPGRPAAAEEPDIPYFQEYSGADFNQDADAQPIVGHFTDQVFDDILWYQPGSGKESLWTPCPDCAHPFTKRQLPLALQVGGYYRPIVADFAGDGLDDIYWLSGSSAADYLWTNLGAGTFQVRRFDAPADEANPLVLPDSRSSSGKDDLLWLAGTGQRSRLWVFPDDGSGTARTKGWVRTPLGQPLVGDFDGNGAADVLWYPHTTSCRCPTPSAAANDDHLWRRTSGTAATFTETTLNIKGEYAPLVGRFSGQGDARDDILWIGQDSVCCSGPTDRPDSLWEGRANGTFLASSPSFPSAGGGVLLEHDTADTALIFDYDLQTAKSITNVWFDTTSGPVLRPLGNQLPNGFEPVFGRFVDASREDLFAYYAGTKTERLYHPIF